MAWRRPRVATGERDPFLPALIAGSRYVRNEPVVQRLLVRFATFMVPACAVWALLPLIASRQLGLAANGYGLLFAALGSGAVVAALGLGWVKQHLSSNGIVGLAAVSFGVAFAALVVVPNMWVALPLLVICGFGWTATVSTVISELQLFLPSWVRARAIAIYLMVFLGCQAVASPIWGLITQHAGLRTAVLLAAALVAVSAAGGLIWKIPDNQHLDRTPAAYWGPATITLEPEPQTGPVVVAVEYDVADDSEADFLAAMERHATLPAPQRSIPLGAVPGRREPRGVRRAVPGADLAGTPPPARWSSDRGGPGHRGRRLRPRSRRPAFPALPPASHRACFLGATPAVTARTGYAFDPGLRGSAGSSSRLVRTYRPPQSILVGNRCALMGSRTG